MRARQKNTKVISASDLDVTCTIADAIYLIASSLERLPADNDNDARAALLVKLNGQFDQCFSDNSSEDIDAAVRLLSASEHMDMRKLWDYLEGWSECAETASEGKTSSGMLFVLPILWGVNNAAAVRPSAQSMLAIKAILEESLFAGDCRVVLKDHVYRADMLAELDWLQVKSLSNELRHPALLGATEGEGIVELSDMASVESVGGDTSAYFIVGYVQSPADSECCVGNECQTEMFADEDFEKWNSRIVSELQSAFSNRVVIAEGPSVLSFHKGLRKGSQMAKLALMSSSVRECMVRSELFAEEITASICAYSSFDGEDDGSTIVRARLSNKETDRLIGGCEYVIDVAEDPRDVGALVEKTLKELGLADVKCLPVVDVPAYCSGCGEAVYMAPGVDGAAPKLEHLSEILEEDALSMTQTTRH